MNANLLLQLMGLAPKEETPAEETTLQRMMASKTTPAAKKPMTKAEAQKFNVVPTRSELPVDKAYSKQLQEAAKYKAAVDAVNAAQTDADKNSVLESHMQEYADVPVPASVANGETNLKEAMNPSTAKNVVNKIMRDRISAAALKPGSKQSASGSQNNFVTDELNDQFITNVAKASEGLGLGAFDQNYTVPELTKLKQKMEAEIAKQESRKDNSQGVWNAMIAAQMDPTKDFDKVYKFDAPTNIKDLREKISKIVMDQSKAFGDTEKYKATLYANQRLPNTSYTEEDRQAPPPRTGGGAGAGKRITEKTLSALSKAEATARRFDKAIEKIQSSRNLMGKVQQGKNFMANLVGLDSDSSALHGYLTSLKQDFGKNKEGGVLREADERKYDKMFPNIGTNPDVAIENLKILKQETLDDISSFKRTLKGSGYDTSGLGAIADDSASPVPEKTAPSAAPSGSKLSEIQKRKKEVEDRLKALKGIK